MTVKKNEIYLSTKIALFMVLIGLVLMVYSMHQINEGVNETEDWRTHNNKIEYENGTVTSSDTSIKAENRDHNSQPINHPKMEAYGCIFVCAFIMAMMFGFLGVISEFHRTRTREY